MLTRQALIRIGTFGLVGLASTATYVVVFEIAALAVKLNLFLCNMAGYLVATVVSYVGHHTFTFRATGGHGYFGPRFIVQAAVAFAISTLVATAGVYYNVPHLGVACIIALLLPILNFCTLQFWVFAHPAQHN